MIVSCKRENLANGLAIVGRMVKQRATLPVLSNIMLSTDKGRLKLAATDLEAAVCTWIGGKIDEEGAVTAPARTMTDYILASSDETILLTVKETDIGLTSEHNKANIKGLEASEFPIIPKIKGAEPVKVPADKLKKAILSVSFAAALDEARPVLAGLLIKSKNNSIYIVATDSYRLAEQVIKVDKVVSPFEVIIPSRTANELARILPQDKTDVLITIGENQVEFAFGDIEFSTRQIEGSFPDYNQIIPKDFVCEIESERGSFVEAVKVASIFARETGGNIKVSASDGRATINAVSSQTGDTQGNFAVDFTGTPITVAFNAKYILDALSIMEGQRVKVGFSGELNPALITSAESEGLKYIIMPLRSE